MQLLIQALKNGMAQEEEGYTALSALAEEKKDALIKNDLKRLNESIRRETEAVKRLKALNAEQEGRLLKIAAQCKLDHAPDITELLEILTEETDKQALADLRQKLQTVIRRLQEQTALNQSLLETQLQYTNFCLEVLTQGDTVGDIYGSSGYVNDDTPRRGFINREI